MINKFAAIIKENNNLVYIDSEEFNKKFKLQDIINPKENVRILNCTGLKDIDGKYIMEGDIIEVFIENIDLPIKAIVSYSNGFTSFSLYFPSWHYNNPNDLLDYLDWQSDADLNYKLEPKILGNLLDFNKIFV